MDELSGFHLPAQGIVFPEILAKIGLDQAGGDGVDPDVECAEFLRPRTCHHHQPGFGEAVEQSSQLRSQAGNGGDVDDRPATLAFDHLGDNTSDEAQGCLDVDLDHLVQHLVRDRERRTLADVGRAIVDQNIHRAETRFGFLHQALNLVCAPDVAGNGHDSAGKRRKFLRGRLEVFQFATGNDHVGPGFRQPLRDRFANAAASARDEGHFAGQIVF